MAIGKFRKGARPRTRWWQPWWLVRTGGRGWLLLCDTCTQRLCGTQHSCACVYKLCERDWHAIEINRCGCVMATISNIRGGGYCEIDCTRFFSPLSFFPFFFLPFHMITTSTIVYGKNSSERKEAGARYLCGRSSALWARQWSSLRFVHCMSSPGVHSELFLRAFEVCTPVLGIYWRIAMNDGYCLLV